MVSGVSAPQCGQRMMASVRGTATTQGVTVTVSVKLGYIEGGWMLQWYP